MGEVARCLLTAWVQPGVVIRIPVLTRILLLRRRHCPRRHRCLTVLLRFLTTILRLTATVTGTVAATAVVEMAAATEMVGGTTAEKRGIEMATAMEQAEITANVTEMTEAEIANETAIMTETGRENATTDPKTMINRIIVTATVIGGAPPTTATETKITKTETETDAWMLPSATLKIL